MDDVHNGYSQTMHHRVVGTRTICAEVQYIPKVCLERRVETLTCEVRRRAVHPIRDYGFNLRMHKLTGS